MKRITENIYKKLWVTIKPKYEYYTTINGDIYSYNKKNGFKKIKPKFIKTIWYNRIRLWSKQVLWHRVILMNYKKQPKWIKDINHVNWIKTDNRLENLERTTKSHNILEAQRLWLKPTQWIYQLDLNWNVIKHWKSINDIKKQYKSISNFVRKKYLFRKWYWFIRIREENLLNYLLWNNGKY